MIKTKDKSKTPQNEKPEKFFFDQNNFDDDYEEEIEEEEEPPPPTFSEEELTSAQEASYLKGKQDATREAEQSREKRIADLINVIKDNFQTLFVAEQEREQRFEGEVIVLCEAIFTKLFPALNEKQGLTEITSVISTVLQSQREQEEIIIKVNENYRDSIEERLGSLAEGLPSNCKVTVTGSGSLGDGDCHIEWKDGGARRNAENIAKEIHRHLEQTLADKPTLRDNVEDEQINEADVSTSGEE